MQENQATKAELVVPYPLSPFDAVPGWPASQKARGAACMEHINSQLKVWERELCDGMPVTWTPIPGWYIDDDFLHLLAERYRSRNWRVEVSSTHTLVFRLPLPSLIRIDDDE